MARAAAICSPMLSDLAPRLGEHERCHRGVARVGQPLGGVVLHGDVGVLERLPHRVGRIGTRDPDQGPRRLQPDRGPRAVEHRDQGRQGRGIAQLAQAVERRFHHLEPVVPTLLLERLRGGRQREERLESPGISVPGECLGRAEPDVGVRVLHRLGQCRQGVGVDQRLHRQEPDLAVLVLERPDQQRLRRGRVLLDQLVDGPLAEVGIARSQRRLEELEPLRLLEGELERLAAERRVGIVEELEQKVPAPGLADLGHRLGEHLAADVRVDAPQGEPECTRAGPARLDSQRRLERLGPDRREAVVERTGQQRQGGFGRGFVRARTPDGALADLLDQDLEPAAAHVFMRGVQARLGGRQRVGLVQSGHRGEGGIADLGLRVVEHRAEPLRRARVVERGHRRGRPRPGRSCPPPG